MKALLIIIIVVVAAIFGIRYYAEHSRPSLDKLKQDQADTQAHYENEKEAVKKFFEEQDKLNRLKGNE
jgi:Tfp pilus assembly protein PilO